MKKEKGAPKEIHISDIDAFLAENLVGAEGSALAFNVSRKDSEGNIMIEILGKSEVISGENPVDFELSPSESLHLLESDIGQFISRPVYTSSAHEFFDFLLTNYSSFDFVAEFTGNAWRVIIQSPSDSDENYS